MLRPSLISRTPIYVGGNPNYYLPSNRISNKGNVNSLIYLIDPLEAARVLARAHGDSIVVPHPANERYWSQVSGAPERDFMPPQADGEEAAFVLDLSIARPENRLIMLEVDEALLSNLGVLVTISDAAPQNLVHVLFQSGGRSGKAGLLLPGGSDTDFATIARGAGYLNACQFDVLGELAEEAARILNESGPTMLVIKVDPFSGGWNDASPPRRHDMSDAIRDSRANLGDADKP